MPASTRGLTSDCRSPPMRIAGKLSVTAWLSAAPAAASQPASTAGVRPRSTSPNSPLFVGSTTSAAWLVPLYGSTSSRAGPASAYWYLSRLFIIRAGTVCPGLTRNGADFVAPDSNGHAQSALK